MDSPHLTPAAQRPRVRFDVHELGGAFGDIGTDLPLMIALIATCGLDAASVCLLFGLLQMVSGFWYGLPMPVQPLKAMAAIMLAQKLSPGTLSGAGLVIGVVMLLLALTGALDWLARVVPKAVVRGIQLGLGVSLSLLALKEYAGADGAAGYAMAGVATVLLLALRRQKLIPAPLVVLAVGFAYAWWFKVDNGMFAGAFGVRWPQLVIPNQAQLVQGALLLALPQIPLSLGNSVIATSQVTRDLFPERAVSVRQIGLTYGVMNLVAPWFGGIPVCHGCGGLVGFHGFGARTGGAAVFYGAFYVFLGLFCAPGFATVVKVFPMPVLGVVLFFEAVALMSLIRDIVSDRNALWVTLAVAGAVFGLPYGYVVGLVGGTVLSLALKRGWVSVPGSDSGSNS